MSKKVTKTTKATKVTKKAKKVVAKKQKNILVMNKKK